MDQYCKEHNFSGWFETSAKDNIGIDKAVKFLIGKILENRVTEKPVTSGLVKPGAKEEKKNTQNSGCCP
jgi:Ras-related protein Rab-32